MPTDWADKVRDASPIWKQKPDRVLEPDQAIALIAISQHLQRIHAH
jgi:hypothetical protein